LFFHYGLLLAKKSRYDFYEGLFFIHKKFYQEKSQDEAADVGQPGDARTVSGGKKLKKEPDDQEDRGRDIHGGDHDKNKDKRADARRGEKRQVSAHYSGDRAAGADDRNQGIHIEQYMDQSGADAAQQIE
jgi:hypothetical protein